MNPKRQIDQYTIKYNLEKKKFFMWDKDGNPCGEDFNGRELGRDAWFNGAEAVRYDYDLTLDENFPLDRNL